MPILAIDSDFSQKSPVNQEEGFPNVDRMTHRHRNIWVSFLRTAIGHELCNFFFLSLKNCREQTGRSNLVFSIVYEISFYLDY